MLCLLELPPPLLLLLLVLLLPLLLLLLLLLLAFASGIVGAQAVNDVGGAALLPPAASVCL